MVSNNSMLKFTQIHKVQGTFEDRHHVPWKSWRSSFMFQFLGSSVRQETQEKGKIRTKIFSWEGIKYKCIPSGDLESLT